MEQCPNIKPTSEGAAYYLESSFACCPISGYESAERNLVFRMGPGTLAHHQDRVCDVECGLNQQLSSGIGLPEWEIIITGALNLWVRQVTSDGVPHGSE
jgi:hypothetical protein